jgi:hypothetical protein
MLKISTYDLEKFIYSKRSSKFPRESVKTIALTLIAEYEKILTFAKK